MSGLHQIQLKNRSSGDVGRQERSIRTNQRLDSCDRGLECQFCKIGFRKTEDLKKHERIHTGEKPFKCKFCKKAFTQSGNLQRHERIHTGEKPFECKFCTKSFARCGSLKKHECIHTRKIVLVSFLEENICSLWKLTKTLACAWSFKARS